MLAFSSHKMLSEFIPQFFLSYRTGDIYAALRDIETSLSLSPSHKLSQQRRIQCLMDLDMHEEANRFLHQYQLDHPSDSKFTNRTKKELEKSKSIKDGRVQGKLNVKVAFLKEFLPS